jgi:hypothetical protein
MDKNSFAPRVGVAWRLDGVSAIRAGYGRFIADVTDFINFVSRDQYGPNLNMMDPKLSYKYKAEPEPNPFTATGLRRLFPVLLSETRRPSRSPLSWCPILSTEPSLKPART